MNAITFIFPSNNELNVDSIMRSLENKLGLIDHTLIILIINHFSLMQSLNMSSLTDDILQAIGNKIP